MDRRGMMSLHSEQGEEKSKGFSLDEELKSLDSMNMAADLKMKRRKLTSG
jgi:hypothetical protein